MLRRGLLFFLVCGLALFLTGCFWFRLLALKNQLAEFDRYVKVDDRDGLTFEFVKPVLYAADVRALFEVEPASKTTNQNQQTWSWVFEKIAATNTEPKEFDLTFKTGFTNDKLSRLSVPDRFLAFVPKESFVAMARALGQAKVDRKKRSATAQYQAEKPKTEVRRLSRTELSELLGPPLHMQDSKEGTAYLYEYRLNTPSLQKVQAPVARARCTFDKASDSLRSVQIRYGEMSVNVSFDPSMNRSADALIRAFVASPFARMRASALRSWLPLAFSRTRSLPK